MIKNAALKPPRPAPGGGGGHRAPRVLFPRRVFGRGHIILLQASPILRLNGIRRMHW
jgi:hypothetical protein